MQIPVSISFTSDKTTVSHKLTIGQSPVASICKSLNNKLVQPLIKRESVWLDHKTLFPVLEMGFCFGYPFERDEQPESG